VGVPNHGGKSAAWQAGTETWDAVHAGQHTFWEQTQPHKQLQHQERLPVSVVHSLAREE